MRKWMTLLLVLMMIPVIAAADGAVTLSVTDAVENENAFGRCVVPAGYSVEYAVVSCTESQSVAYPCMAVITAAKDGGTELLYISARDYIAGTGEDAATQDGQFNTDFQTPMLHYMTAGEYCDYVAGTTFTQLADGGNVIVAGIRELPEIEDAYRRIMEPDVQKLRNGLDGTVGNIDDVKTSMCMKGYEFQIGGITHYGIVLTGNIGVWVSAQGPLSTISWVNWVVPFTYVMYAPEDATDAMEAFELFVTNTRTSDQFDKANREMSEELWKIIKNAHDIRDCYDYSAQRIREATAEGNDYSEDRVSDYIFDQNDYTLEDGSHVKVSTGYSYVWEGDNGSVYASNSLSDQPGGSRQLYPNP